MIDKTSIISKKAHIDETCSIGPNCIIGDDVVLGKGCNLFGNVIIQQSTIVGMNNTFFPFSVIGSDPQDLTYSGEPTSLEIGDNTFREYVSVHRGTIKQDGITKIGNANFFMAYSHIGHDSQIKNRVHIGSYSAIAGHVVINDDAFVLSNVAISQFIRVGRNAFISACSVVSKDIPPFAIAFGTNCKTFLRGANIKGLKKKRFSRNDIIKCMDIYKVLRGDTLLSEKIMMLNKIYGNDKIFLEIKSFIEDSSHGILS